MRVFLFAAAVFISTTFSFYGFSQGCGTDDQCNDPNKTSIDNGGNEGINEPVRTDQDEGGNEGRNDAGTDIDEGGNVGTND